MNLITYNKTIPCRLHKNDNSTASGSLIILDINNDTCIHYGNSITSENITEVTLNDLKPTIDTYFINAQVTGCYGEGRLYKGFSPATLVYKSYFQDCRSTNTGTEVFYTNFETGTITGCNTVSSGSGLVHSGVISSSGLEGNYYLGLDATNNAFYMITPTGVATSGLSCGRAIWLTRPSRTNTTTVYQHAPLFAFCRQNNTPTSPCYKVAVESLGTTSSYNSVYSIKLYANNLILNSSTYTNVDSNQLAHYRFEFNNSNSRINNYRKVWTMVEWEILPTGTLFNLYGGVFDNQTTNDIQWIKNNLDFLGQFLYTGGDSGSNYYTYAGTTAFLLATNNNVRDIGIDELYIEALTNLDFKGLNSLTLTGTTTSGSGGSRSSLYLVRNVPSNIDIEPVAVSRFSKNPLVSAYDSITGIAGDGYSVYAPDNQPFDRVASIYAFRETMAAGILNGILRVSVRLLSSSYPSKIGVCFLRQGNSIGSNCYTVELTSIGSNSWVARLLKGTGGDAFSGTLLSTSSNLSDDGQTIFIDIRWKVINSSRVDIEILSYNHSTNVIYDADVVDTSPGSVDYGSSVVLSYTDNSAPYTLTSVTPLVIFSRHTNSSSSLYVYNLELWRID